MSEYLRSKIQEFGQLKQASLRKLASTPTARSVRAMQIINDAILPTGEEIVMQAKLAGAVVNEVEVDGHIEHTKIAHPSYANIPYYLQDLPYSESELRDISKTANYRTRIITDPGVLDDIEETVARAREEQLKNPRRAPARKIVGYTTTTPIVVDDDALRSITQRLQEAQQAAPSPVEPPRMSANPQHPVEPPPPSGGGPKRGGGGGGGGGGGKWSTGAKVLGAAALAGTLGYGAYRAFKNKDEQQTP